MVFLVEKISQEMIKPSSPTPSHLREYKISLIDQTIPEVFTPLVFFYQGNNSDSTKTSHKLKQSLSKCLTSFYPLAGRIQQETLCILCNDEGAEFFEARVHGVELMDITQNPKMDQLKELLPVQSIEPRDGRGLILAVQVNFLQSDGIAIAVCLSHKIGDTESLVTFVNAWAMTCRGEGDDAVPRPRFVFAHYFPPQASSVQTFPVTTKNLLTKTLIFSKEKLTALKATISAAPGSNLNDPTRYESLSAFIWKLFIETEKKKRRKLTDKENAIMPPKSSVFAAVQAVNMRPRFVPEFTKEAFGNGILFSMAFSSMAEGQELHHLATKLRNSIQKIDAAYIKEQVQKDGRGYYLKSLSDLNVMAEEGTGLFTFTGWLRFPVYAADFGYGRPVWVCTTTTPFSNYAILMDRPCGVAIEAWINLYEEDEKSFELEHDIHCPLMRTGNHA